MIKKAQIWVYTSRMDILYIVRPHVHEVIVEFLVFPIRPSLMESKIKMRIRFICHAYGLLQYTENIHITLRVQKHAIYTFDDNGPILF